MNIASAAGRIVIAGGGLGGLSAALAFAQSGWNVLVLEQAPEFGAIGYGIQLGPNVFPMFERLGVKDGVLAQSYLPSGLAMLDAFSGETISRIPTGEDYRARFGSPYACVHRIDLHMVLIDACRAHERIELRESAPVSGFEEIDSGVRVHFGEGESVDGALLVGADGLRSPTRTAIVEDAGPEPTGFVAHRTLVPMDEVSAHLRRSEVCLWSGPGLHIVHYPLRRGELFNIVAVFKTPRHSVTDNVDAYKREVQSTYADTHPHMKELLALMNFERRWALSDRRPVRHWSRGRVCLLGDAAHPTLQSLAQGAGMAIEDAVHLAAHVSADRADIPAALRAYARGRYLRTARVQIESRQLWEFYHLEDPIEVEVRNSQQSEISTEDHYRCLSWLWDGVPVPTGAAVASGPAERGDRSRMVQASG
jgi:salicylate hydroxylase